MDRAKIRRADRSATLRVPCRGEVQAYTDTSHAVPSCEGVGHSFSEIGTGLPRLNGFSAGPAAPNVDHGRSRIPLTVAASRLRRVTPVTRLERT